MKRTVWVVAAGLALGLLVPATAQATPGLTAEDAATNAALIAAAERAPIVADKSEVGPGGVAPRASTDPYPRRKGMILVTPDPFKGLIPTGHAAIVYDNRQVVESIDIGVRVGPNDWYKTKRQAFGVTVKGMSVAQDAAAADWARAQVGKPYNYNFLDIGTRDRFYCSQLVWAAFKDTHGVDLNTPAWGHAIHPMELVHTKLTDLVYRKN